MIATFSSLGTHLQNRFLGTGGTSSLVHFRPGAGSFRSGQLEVVQALLAGHQSGIDCWYWREVRKLIYVWFLIFSSLHTLESGRRRCSLRLSHWCREIFMLSTTSTTFKGKVPWLQLRQFGRKFGYRVHFCEAMLLSEFFRLPVMFS